MDRLELIECIRDAVPAEKNGLKITILPSEERPDIELTSTRCNERATLFFISDILRDVGVIDTKYRGEYSEYVVVIHSIRPNLVRYGKKVFK